MRRLPFIVPMERRAKLGREASHAPSRRAAIFLALAVLAGCTTLPAVNEGKRLFAEGRVDEGLATLERAARENPGNAAARSNFVTMRESIVSERVRQADSRSELRRSQRSGPAVSASVALRSRQHCRAQRPRRRRARPAPRATSSRKLNSL